MLFFANGTHLLTRTHKQKFHQNSKYVSYLKQDIDYIVFSKKAGNRNSVIGKNMIVFIAHIVESLEYPQVVRYYFTALPANCVKFKP